MNHIAPPWWLPNGHFQTIWPALRGRRLSSGGQLQRQRWPTPDGDFIDVDRNQASLSSPCRPLLVLFHGLEGSSASHYARLFHNWAENNGLGFAVPHFRGCSGQINTGPRAYHSGDHAEVDWVLNRLKSEFPSRPIVALGVSLGGNALAHWLCLQGSSAARVVSAAAAVSAPLDLTASGHAMGKGFNRRVYGRMFLRTMVPKALEKWRQHPGLFSKEALLAAKTLHAFDNAFTAPVHGFGTADNYWKLASALPILREVRVPLLLLNALNDPFVPRWSLPSTGSVSDAVTLWQPLGGGHVGFPSTDTRAAKQFNSLMAMPDQVGSWLMAHVKLPVGIERQ